MNISKVFIERPVATIVLTAAIIIFGWIAYKSLPVSELPNVDFATISVSASLPGADPETMANAVATPLEKQFSAIASLDTMSSVSSAGQTSITLQFNLNRNIDAAAQDVQTAIAQATKSLPPEMTTPPTLRKANPAATPILYLAFTAENLPLTVLNDYAETRIAQRLSMVSGVAQVLVFGPQEYAVRIHLNPAAMAARGLGASDAVSAIQAINTNQPSGTLESHARTYTVKSYGQLTNAAAFNNAILSYTGNAPLRLKDIGYAEDSVANNETAAWFNGKRAIVLAIQRQPGTNTVEVAQNIKKLLPELTKELPGTAQLHIVYDRSVFIEKGLTDVKLTLLLAIGLVALVILLFLGNISSTMIAILSLPVSLLGTFGVMYLLGYSLDNLSLIGLVLAVGFIVDDAIVVLENIVRYLEAGMDKLQAAFQGSKEIVFTVISMTISLVAVFIPLLFMGGLLGRLFHEFAMVVSISILISGIVSLTLTPTLCSQLLRPKKNEHSLFPRFERLFAASKHYYERSLRWSLENRKTILWGTLGILILTIVLFATVSKGFIPSEDADIIFGNTKMPVGTVFADSVKRQQAVAKIIQANPNVAKLISTVGQGGDASKGPTSGQLVIGLKPSSERDFSADQILAQLRRQVQKVPGIQVNLRNPPAISAGGKVTGNNYQYVLQGSDWEQLQSTAEIMEHKMSELPELQDVNSDLEISNPQIGVHILRERAAALGVTPAEIETSLYNTYGQRQISTIYTPTNEYQVISEVNPEFQQNMSSLNAINVRGANGTLIPLSTLVTLREEAGPMSISHYGQLPAVTLSFNLPQGVSLGDATKVVTELAKTTLPSGIIGTFTGSAQVFQSSLSTLPILLLITVLVIYIVLAILYEHFIHPITILTALPFAGFGALLMLLIFHLDLDIFSFIGIIMLVGLVKKNGIMMVDFAIEARREQAISPYDAILQACLIRFRPIMMTTMTAILATLPIALGLGAGGDAHRSLGVAVVGGLLFSQMLTLYVTPVFYLTMESLIKRKKTPSPTRGKGETLIVQGQDQGPS